MHPGVEGGALSLFHVLVRRKMVVAPGSEEGAPFFSACAWVQLSRCGPGPRRGTKGRGPGPAGARPFSFFSFDFLSQPNGPVCAGPRRREGELGPGARGQPNWVVP